MDYEDYQERAKRMQKEREVKYADLSTQDKAKWRNLETQYEIESSEGMASNVSKDEWIKSRMYGSR